MVLPVVPPEERPDDGPVYPGPSGGRSASQALCPGNPKNVAPVLPAPPSPAQTPLHPRPRKPERIPPHDPRLPRGRAGHYPDAAHLWRKVLYSWKHSGFNVHAGEKVPPEAKADLEGLAQYSWPPSPSISRTRERRWRALPQPFPAAFDAEPAFLSIPGSVSRSLGSRLYPQALGSARFVMSAPANATTA